MTTSTRTRNFSTKRVNFSMAPVTSHDVTMTLTPDTFEVCATVRGGGATASARAWANPDDLAANPDIARVRWTPGGVGGLQDSLRTMELQERAFALLREEHAQMVNFAVNYVEAVSEGNVEAFLTWLDGKGFVRRKGTERDEEMRRETAEAYERHTVAFHTGRA